jgi:hypothetical protein
MSEGCAEIVSSFLPLHLVYAAVTIVILLEQIFKSSQAWILFLTKKQNLQITLGAKIRAPIERAFGLQASHPIPKAKFKKKTKIL